jgi:hypothetical protein
MAFVIAAVPHPKMKRLGAPIAGRPRAEVMSATKGTPRRMRLISFKPMEKGALRGFASIELPIGLKVHDVPVLVGKNGSWASLPSKPLLDNCGQYKRDPNGKAMYVPVLEWRDRELSDKLSAAVCSSSMRNIRRVP